MTNKNFSFGEAFKSGWARLKEHWLFFVLAYTTVAVASGIFSALAEGPYKGIEPTSGILALIGLAIRIWLNFNLLVATIRIFDGVSPKWQDLFIWREETISYVGASILYFVMVLLGCLFFLIPGLYLAVKYGFYGFLIADKKLGAFDAPKMSGQLTAGAKWPLVGFGLASLGIVILGALAFGVGLFVAIPVVSIAFVFVYRSLYDQAFDLATATPGTVVTASVVPTAETLSQVTEAPAVAKALAAEVKPEIKAPEVKVAEATVTPAPEKTEKVAVQKPDITLVP